MFQRDLQQFDINVLHKTPDGYYQGNVVCTGVGVFRYLGNDRKFVGRLRDVEDVKAATKTINCIPVTLQHPNSPVNVDNVSDLQVGMTANDASFDGLNNHVTVTITNKKAIEAIDKGEVKAFSMGYKCNVVDNAGVWQGVHHDQQQKDIVYNHIALVKNGRAGDKVRFMVGDSADFGDIFEIDNNEEKTDIKDKGTEHQKEVKAPSNDGAEPPKNPETFVNDNKNLEPNNRKEQSMKTIQLDGVDYQADEKVIEALQTAQNDAAEKLDEIHTLLDGIDERDSKIADLEEQLAQANDEIDESVIDAAVNAKLEILDAARAAGIECDTSDDVSDLKRQVIAAAFDSIDLESVEDEAAINSLYMSANKVIADRAEKGGCNGGKGGTKKNPAAQFDGAANGGANDDQFDSAEDRLQKRMVKISHGQKEDN
jgi:hypothetical protein